MMQITKDMVDTMVRPFIQKGNEIIRRDLILASEAKLYKNEFNSLSNKVLFLKPTATIEDAQKAFMTIA